MSNVSGLSDSLTVDIFTDIEMLLSRVSASGELIGTVGAGYVNYRSKTRSVSISMVEDGYDSLPGISYLEYSCSAPSPRISTSILNNMFADRSFKDFGSETVDYVDHKKNSVFINDIVTDNIIGIGYDYIYASRINSRAVVSPVVPLSLLGYSMSIALAEDVGVYRYKEVTLGVLKKSFTPLVKRFRFFTKKPNSNREYPMDNEARIPNINILESFALRTPEVRYETLLGFKDTDIGIIRAVKKVNRTIYPASKISKYRISASML